MVGFFVGLMVTALLLFCLLRMNAGMPMDMPNHRSLHQTPIPRVGGLGLVPGILVGSAVSASVDIWVLVSVIVLAAVSYFDDRNGLPVIARFGTHLSVAIAWVVMWNGVGAFSTICLTVLLIGWMINLYNFMDGSDGLAGGMALFGFSAYGFAAHWSGQPDLSAFAFVIAGAALGFLVFNFHPARVFLGDAGSIPLGFLVAAMGLMGWQFGAWPLWFPVLIFSPFIVDASVTIVRRALRGERVWQAHREHYYQRLIRMGWGHRRTAFAEYVLMLALAVSGVFALGQASTVQIAILLAWCTIYLIAMCWVDAKWQQFNESRAQ